jgi:hypothetical protein
MYLPRSGEEIIPQGSEWGVIAGFQEEKVWLTAIGKTNERFGLSINNRSLTKRRQHNGGIQM